jgi:hypothetical protein
LVSCQFWVRWGAGMNCMGEDYAPTAMPQVHLDHGWGRW